VEIELPDTTASFIPSGYTIFITDLGNAGTNNIIVIENTTALAKLNLDPSFVMDTDDQAIVIERINGQWLIIGNSGFPPLASFQLKNNASVTTISAANTPVDIAGTATASSQNNLWQFTTGPNVLESLAGNTYKAIAQVNGSLKRSVGASVRDYALLLHQDTGSGFNLVARGEVVVGVTQQSQGLSFGIPVTVSKGDKFKVMVENRDTIDDIIVDYDIEIKPDRRV